MKGTFAGSVLLLVDTITGGVSLLHSGGNDWVQLGLLVPGAVGVGVALHKCADHLLTGGGDHFDFAERELHRRGSASDPMSLA